MSYICSMSNIKNSTLEEMVKSKFLTIYDEACNMAESVYQSHFKRLEESEPNALILSEIYTAIHKLLEASKKLDYRPYYTMFSSKDALLKLYASRNFLIGDEDDELLKEAVRLSKLIEKLRALFDEVKRRIGYFKVVDFLDNKIEPILLGDHFITNHFSIEDCNEIRFIQFGKLHTALQSSVRIVSDYIKSEFLKSPVVYRNCIMDIKHYKHNIENVSFDNPSDLLSAYSKLSFLRKIDINNLESDLLLKSFKDFKARRMNWELITPDSWFKYSSFSYPIVSDFEFEGSYKEESVPMVENPEANDLAIILELPYFFYVVRLIISWFESFEVKSDIQKKFSLDNIFRIDKELEEVANRRLNESIEEYENLVEHSDITTKGVIELYRNDLLLNLNQFFQLEGFEKELYKSFLSKTPSKMYIGCIFYSIEEYKLIYLEVKRLFLNIKYLTNHLLTINGTNELKFENLVHNGHSDEIMELLNLLILENKHCITGLLAKNKWEGYVKYGINNALTEYYYNSNFQKLFYSVYTNTLNYYDNSTNNNKILYLKQRLEEAKSIAFERRIRLNSNNFCGYTNHLIDVLENRLTIFSREQKAEEKKIKKEGSIKIFPKTIPTKKAVLKELLFTKNVEAPLIDTDKCSLKDIEDIFNGEIEFDKLRPVYFICKNYDVYRLVEELMPIVRNLSVESFTKLKLFYSKKGVLLTANNLYASKSQNKL